ncbi:MAG: Uma2 family endonuclease [Roseiflexaceae bacterium]|nr:Uma2 family endonuclease [Roseiflexaceae bacterium]
MTVASRWTSADLEQFPDDPTLRYEIIDGKLYVSKVPNWYHQVIADRIGDALRRWNETSAAGEAVSGPGIIPPDDDNLIPDLVWISHERLAAGLGSDGKLHLLPELIVEVLSPGLANERRDRTDKLAVYGRQGVREYWIADRKQRTIEVYRTTGDILAHAATIGERETLDSPLLPGFALALERVFRTVPQE